MYKMEKWARIKYQPCLPLGDNNSKITGCQRHIELSMRAAGEGTVLLKNDGELLPLKSGTRLAIFGKAQIDYVKGGGGSGFVHSAYVRNIYDAFKDMDVEIFDELSLYYKKEVENAYKAGGKNGMLTECEIPGELLKAAKEFTDTAIITINRYSSEDEDRYGDGTDSYYNLSNEEKAMIETVTDNFKNIIVLLNTGAMIDSSWFSDNPKIKSALMIWQGGMEGALATASIVMGKINPSGKLVDTCARELSDFPSSEGFHESRDYVRYTEDIFVGYRYFETIPGMAERVVYPFGYGLSYTSFEFSDITCFVSGDNINVSVKITNTGSMPGKEVAQLYYSAPNGKITKARLELCAFKKTKELSPKASETLILSFDAKDMASFDDMGDVEKNAYVMEKGEYKLFVGSSVRNLQELEYKYTLSDDKILEKLEGYCEPQSLGSRLMSDGEYRRVEDRKIIPKKFPCTYESKENIPSDPKEYRKLIDVSEGRLSLDDFISQLSCEQLIELTHGQRDTGVSNTNGMGNLREFGIPTPMTIDGPAGVRINPETGVRTTAFPVATMLACTWNTDILVEIGKAGALECKENNLSIWLTPALNIHRSPLCGRNFEYYSEDPHIAGKMAAAMVRGIQSQSIVATPKHFACNNKETNRYNSDSIVSARALREIYIKGFEICVKEADPKLIMTAYNIINGVRASENAELIEGILRGEWGYKGLVTTDWWNHASKTKEIIAGNDIRMPAGTKNDAVDGYKNGELTRNQVAICVKRLLEMIMWLE